MNLRVVLSFILALAVRGQDTNLETACTLTVNEVTGDEGKTNLSFSLSDITFENCDGGSVNIIAVSVTSNCGIDAQDESSKESIYDGDEFTDFTCVWDGTDGSPKIRLVFNPASIYGYDIIASSGELPYSWDLVCEGLMELTDTQTQVAAALEAEDNDKYSEHNFFGVFAGNECVRSTDSVGGDPFITTANGDRRQFWLPQIGEWIPLLHSESLQLSARAFALPGTYNQWIDGLRITETKNESNIILSIEIPYDSPLGSIATDHSDSEVSTSLDFLQVFLQGIPLEHITSEVTTTDGAVAVQAAKLASKTIMGKPSDSLWVRTLDFAFHVYASPATKFDDIQTNEAFSHLNFKFTSLPRDGSVAGFFADVVLAADESQLTSLSKSFLTKPKHPYPDATSAT